MSEIIKPKEIENILAKYGYAKPQGGLTRADLVRRGIPLAEVISELGGFENISKEIGIVQNI